MAYSAPPTFTAGDVLAAADLTILGDDIVYLKGISDGVAFSGVQISRATSQSIADSTDTNISFSTENFDLGGWWSSGTNIVVPAGAIPAGYTSIAVLVTARVRFVANATGGRLIRLNDGGTAFGGSTGASNGTDATEIAATDFRIVEAGDIITLQVRQTSGGALNADIAQITVVRFAPAS